MTYFSKPEPYTTIGVLADVYTRYATAKDVAAYLDSPEGQTPEGEEIAKLVENLKVARKWQPASGHLQFPRDLPEAFREINKIVERFPIQYEASFNRGRFEWRQRPFRTAPEKWVRIVRNLDSQGKLHLSKCKQCGKRFDQRQEDHEHCSLSCKQKTKRHTPKYRKQARKYMRDYMRKHHSKKGASR